MNKIFFKTITVIVAQVVMIAGPRQMCAVTQPQDHLTPQIHMDKLSEERVWGALYPYGMDNSYQAGESARTPQPLSTAKAIEQWKETGFWTSSDKESLLRQQKISAKHKHYTREAINDDLSTGKISVGTSNIITVNSKKYLLLKDFHDYHADVRASYFAYLYDENKNKVFGDPVVIKTVSLTKIPTIASDKREKQLVTRSDQQAERERTDKDLMREAEWLLELGKYFPDELSKRHVKIILDYEKRDLYSAEGGNKYCAAVMPYYGSESLGDRLLKLLADVNDAESGIVLVQLLKQAYAALAEILEAQIKKGGEVKLVVDDLGFYDDYIIDDYTGKVILLDLGMRFYGGAWAQISSYGEAFLYPALDEDKISFDVTEFFNDMCTAFFDCSDIPRASDDFRFVIDVFERTEESLRANPRSAGKLMFALPKMLRSFFIEEIFARIDDIARSRPPGWKERTSMYHYLLERKFKHDSAQARRGSEILDEMHYLVETAI